MDKIAHINTVIQDYFDKHKNISRVPAKDLMPYFVKAGVFSKDTKQGLPIRNILRQLQKSKQLHQIPFVMAEQKDVNTSWFFGRGPFKVNANLTPVAKKEVPTKQPPTSSRTRKESDEHYIIDLCDQVLGLQGSRQHRFDFLLGDPGKNGRATRLPVDVYYESLRLVIEFNEKQHSQPVRFFDKPDKMTVSGVSRGEQRKIYDQRKRTILPKHGIKVISIDHQDFTCDRRGKLMRKRADDLAVITALLKGFIKKP
ncbi:MAG TPA: hypothetical protein PK977_01435 [Chitinophagaceae bacterium]|nr:hypothetical protein [Chitinophagaceae bacterium]